MSYHTDPTRLKKETPDYGQVLAIFNDGHNETTSTGSKWVPPYQSWVQAVQGRLPDAAIAVIGQNPHTSAWANEGQYGPEHVTRIFELSALAARSGWAFANVYQAFMDDPRGLSALIGSDGLHPTPDGYALAGDTLAKLAGIV
jgi:lysophospholipase L1-like esterase